MNYASAETLVSRWWTVKWERLYTANALDLLAGRER